MFKLRYDNGREYINENLIYWCKRKGTVLDTTTPYTPQLNGKAERMNRTLIEKTRALLADAKIGKTLWGEALRTAAFLTNRSLSEAVKQTPFENWTSLKPDLSRLQLFGCTAHTKILTPLKKLDDRCKNYIFVGYALNGYRLYDSKKGKIIISRDVRFSEAPKNTSARINSFFEEKEEFCEEQEENEEVENNISFQSESEEETRQFMDALEKSQSEEEENQKKEDQEDVFRRGKRKRNIPEKLRLCLFVIQRSNYGFRQR